MLDQSKASLFGTMRQDSDEAWRRLFAAWTPKLAGVLRRAFTRWTGDVDSIVADTLTDVFLNRARSSDEDHAWRYACQRAHFRGVDTLRKRTGEDSMEHARWTDPRSEHGFQEVDLDDAMAVLTSRLRKSTRAIIDMRIAGASATVPATGKAPSRRTIRRMLAKLKPLFERTLETPAISKRKPRQRKKAPKRGTREDS
jgi:DNA-directed RNA polymerase specialized sigma24 family protein